MGNTQRHQKSFASKNGIWGTGLRTAVQHRCVTHLCLRIFYWAGISKFSNDNTCLRNLGRLKNIFIANGRNPGSIKIIKVLFYFLRRNRRDNSNGRYRSRWTVVNYQCHCSCFKRQLHVSGIMRVTIKIMHFKKPNKGNSFIQHLVLFIMTDQHGHLHQLAQFSVDQQVYCKK